MTDRTPQRRAAVLRAAWHVFGQRGYNKGSLAEIAEEAGMTRPGVLHHFGSKRQLLVEMLRYRDGEEDTAISDTTQADAPAQLARVLEMVAVNPARHTAVRAYAVLSGESVTEAHPAQPYFRARLAERRTEIARALAGMTGRTPLDSDLTEAASAIIAVIDGLQVQWLLDPVAVDMPRIVGDVIEQSIAKLTTRSQSQLCDRRQN